MDATLQQLKSKLLAKPQEKDEKVRLTANVPVGLWQRCALYATVLESDTSYVVSEALRVFFEEDKAFTEHVRLRPETLPAAPDTANKKKGAAKGKSTKKATGKKTGDDGSPSAAA
jgi:hypothetical protein